MVYRVSYHMRWLLSFNSLSCLISQIHPSCFCRFWTLVNNRNLIELELYCILDCTIWQKGNYQLIIQLQSTFVLCHWINPFDYMLRVSFYFNGYDMALFINNNLVSKFFWLHICFLWALLNFFAFLEFVENNKLDLLLWIGILWGMITDYFICHCQR